MTKRIFALLLSLCLILSAVPVYAGAATGQTVAANAVTVTAGYSATVTLTAENFENIAALDVYVYYDPAVLTLSSAKAGSMLSAAQTSVNTAQAGQVTMSMMALDGISGKGTLLNLQFATFATTTPGTYPISVAIGRAYDGNLTPTTISGVNGSVTVNKPAETETFSIYNYTDKTSLQKGDTLSYRVASASSSRAFVSGEFLVEYDHEVFAFDSVVMESALTGEGAVYSVNASVLGKVRIAYASVDPVKSFYLFTVKLNVIADRAGTTTLKAQTTNMYRENLSMYLPGSTSKNITLQKLPVVEDYPNAFLQTDRLVVGKQSKALFCLEAGAGVAAADFTITYDPAVLRCIAVDKAEGIADKGGMVIVNDNFGSGTIRFSYVNTSAYDEQDLPLVQITWEPIMSPQTHYQITSSAVGVVDLRQNPITLEYVKDTGCIYVATVTDPTCKTEGVISYLCACGDAPAPDVIPTIPEEECTHYTVTFADDDGTVIASAQYHYGEEVTVPADPSKADDETYTYTFTGWDKEVVDCVGDATYTATYAAAYIDYTVIFQDWNGTELSKKTYHYGEAVTAPADPTRAADEVYTYSFAGWDKKVVACVGDATYTATYTAVPVLRGIAVKTMPDKTQYLTGESLDTTGLTLTATYSDGSTQEITEGFSVTGYDPELVGEQLLMVTYEGFTATFTVLTAAAYTPGDINDDGIVDNKDVTRLFQYVSEWDVEVVEAALDVNGDGIVDNKDVTRLFQYVSEWKVEIH